MSKVQPVKRRKPKGSEAVPYDKVPFDVPGRTLEEMIANGYVLETFVGTPRPDGVPWSEIEGLPASKFLKASTDPKRYPAVMEHPFWSELEP